MVRAVRILVASALIAPLALSDGLRQIFADVAIRFEGDLGVRAKGDYRTDRRHYRNWYSEDQAALVAAAFANEISLFGYEF